MSSGQNTGPARPVVGSRLPVPSRGTSRARSPGRQTVSTPQQPKEFDVMISYCWTDKDIVVKCKKELEKKGYKIWFDEEQMPRLGDLYDGMYHGISNSKIICSFLSVHYENSANCKRELRTAADRKQIIVPVRLDCGPFTWTHIITGGAVYIDLSQGLAEWDQKVTELVTNIKQALRRHEQQQSATSIGASHPIAPITPPTSPPASPPVQPKLARQKAPVTAEEKERLKQLHSLLNPVAIGKMKNDIDEISHKRLPGTREWLLDDLKKWATDSTASSVFWLTALAGAGKSVVAATAINELRELEAVNLAAYFICKADHADRNNPVQLIHSIAYQLATKFSCIAKHILELEQEEPGFIATANVSRSFRELIVNSLKEVGLMGSAARDRFTVIVLDALDECGLSESVERNQFLRAFGEMKLPNNIKLLVTSRPVADIRQELEKFEPYEIHLDEARNRADLLLFAEDRVAHKFSRGGKERNAQWAGALVDRSHGLFMWLYLACEEFRGAANGSEVIGDLLAGDKVGTADRAMDAMYLRTLGNAFDGIEREQRNGWFENFRLIVGAIVTLRIPLDLPSLSHLLQVEEDTVADILKRIVSLLYVTDKQIRVIHKSFADFLTDQARCTDERFLINRNGCELHLASKCLRSLNTELKPNMCHIHTSLLNSEIPDLDARIQDNISKHLQYAAQYFIDHFLRAPPDLLTLRPDLLPNFRAFWKEQFLNWLEVVSVLGMVPAATLALLDLNDWAISEGQQFLPDPTVTLVYDAYRFIQEFCTLRSTLKGQKGNVAHVTGVGVSANGLVAVTALYNGTAKVWNAETGALLRIFENLVTPVKSIAATADGGEVVMLCEQGYLEVRDVQTACRVHRLYKIADMFAYPCLAITQSGEVAITKGQNDVVNMWDLRAGVLERT
ncbi:hypothetical protein HDV00_012001 [Rhizophlyctis rosea]|nr:hypothetical protein HDV00_012001 [Rhizophlyctis rosea]